MALFSESGEMLEIEIEGDDQNDSYARVESEKEIILKLSERQQTFKFSGYKSKPVPSLLRGFSAPVKLAYHYLNTELAMLLTHDDDSYANWEAGQTLTTSVIMSMVESLKNNDFEPENTPPKGAMFFHFLG